MEHYEPKYVQLFENMTDEVQEIDEGKVKDWLMKKELLKMADDDIVRLGEKMYAKHKDDIESAISGSKNPAHKKNFDRALGNKEENPTLFYEYVIFFANRLGDLKNDVPVFYVEKGGRLMNATIKTAANAAGS